MVTSDRAWEAAEVIVGTVRKEAERYRMWYQTYATGPGRNGFDPFNRSLHLYAESGDGRTWSKPELGITENFLGSYANNITHVRPTFSRDINPSVLHTARAQGGHAYTLFSWGVGHDLPYNGHFVAWSDDGVRWKDGPETPVIPGYKAGWFMYDEVDATFRGLLLWDRAPTELFATHSTDGVEWSLPRPVLAPDPADTEWAGDDPDNTTLFPAMPITRYGPVLLGFLQVLRGRDIGGRGFDGEMEVQLVCSRDGKAWHRVGDRRPILERGEEESWDGGLVWMGHSLVEDGDRVDAYYTGCRRTAGALQRSRWTKSIGVASWPRDRLVGLSARGDGVIVTTATVAAGDLHVNADAAGGRLTAELLDEDGATAIAGFSAKRGQGARQRRLARPSARMEQRRPLVTCRSHGPHPPSASRCRGLLALVGAIAMPPSTADQSSNDRVLFIDDAQIQSLAGVQRRIHPGARFAGNPLLRGGRAWESDSLMLGTVLKEDGRLPHVVRVGRRRARLREGPPVAPVRRER